MVHTMLCTCRVQNTLRMLSCSRIPGVRAFGGIKHVAAWAFGSANSASGWGLRLSKFWRFSGFPIGFPNLSVTHGNVPVERTAEILLRIAD